MGFVKNAVARQLIQNSLNKNKKEFILKDTIELKLTVKKYGDYLVEFFKKTLPQQSKYN
jgi:hypothetical protein